MPRRKLCVIRWFLSRSYFWVSIKKMKILLTVLILVSVALGFVFAQIVTPQYIDLQLSEEWTTVGCNSDSMGLVLNCNDKLDLEKFTGDIELGEIYIYRKPNKTVVHRAAFCIENCSMVVFRGDNNPKGEIVNRSDIIYRVIGVEYR